jgi:hypothetical protein
MQYAGMTFIIAILALVGSLTCSCRRRSESSCSFCPPALVVGQALVGRLQAAGLGGQAAAHGWARASHR